MVNYELSYKLLCVFLFGIAISVKGHVVTNLDLKHADGSASYCKGGKCTVPAGTSVQIYFELTVGDYERKESTVTNMLFSATIGSGVLFSGYHGCMGNNKVTVQKDDCPNKTITSATWKVTVSAKIPSTKTTGNLVLKDTTDRFKASLPVTVS